jgi:hypothetical protein
MYAYVSYDEKRGVAAIMSGRHVKAYLTLERMSRGNMST